MWLALGSALVFVMGTGGVVLLLLTRGASSHSEVRVEGPPPAAPISASVTVPDAAVRDALDAGLADATDSGADTAPDAGLARAVRERHRREVTAPPSAPPSGSAEPAAPIGGPPPALVRATERMAVGDFDGCLRELEHAGTSAPILGARMNCAMRTGRRSDLEQACALLHRHQPTHAYTRTCDSVLGVTP